MLALLSHDEIIAALRAFPSSSRPLPGLSTYQTTAFEALHKYDPDTFNLFSRLSETGSIAAREALTRRLSQAVKTMLDLIKLRLDDWDGACERVFPKSIKTRRCNKLVFEWNFWNVSHEAKTDGANFRFNGHGYGPEFVDRLKPFLLTPHDDTFWRGVSALYFATEQTWADVTLDLPISKSFIDWAGRSGDIRGVIELARERQTIDVDVLRYLMESDNSHRAIGSGLL